jgi:hypothetical protein
LDVTGYDGALNALGSTMIRFFVWEWDNPLNIRNF